MNILITGAKGQLGQEFKRLQNSFEGNIILTDIDEINICSLQSICKNLQNYNIDFIVNCAAYTDVKKAELEKEKAILINSYGVKNLVNYCEKNKIKLIHISTDYVYSSESLDPIIEGSNINPVNHYGFSKRMGEKYIEKSKLESIIIRTSWLYSRFGKNFVNTIINKLKSETEFCVINDQFGCPTYAKDLATDILKIIKSNADFTFENKIFNYSNLGYTNWFEFANTIRSKCKLQSSIKPVPSHFFENDVKRPKFSVTSKNKIINTFGLKIKNWETSLTNYLTNDLI